MNFDEIPNSWLTVGIIAFAFLALAFTHLAAMTCASGSPW